MSISALIYALCSMLGCIGSAYLGHYITIKAIAHVQPNAESMMQKAGEPSGAAFEAEPNPWEALDAPDTEIEDLEKAFKATELPPEIVDPNVFFGQKPGTIGADLEKS